MSEKCSRVPALVNSIMMDQQIHEVHRPARCQLAGWLAGVYGCFEHLHFRLRGSLLRLITCSPQLSSCFSRRGPATAFSILHVLASCQPRPVCCFCLTCDNNVAAPLLAEERQYVVQYITNSAAGFYAPRPVQIGLPGRGSFFSSFPTATPQRVFCFF